MFSSNNNTQYLLLMEAAEQARREEDKKKRERESNYAQINYSQPTRASTQPNTFHSQPKSTDIATSSNDSSQNSGFHIPEDKNPYISGLLVGLMNYGLIENYEYHDFKNKYDESGVDEQTLIAKLNRENVIIDRLCGKITEFHRNKEHGYFHSDKFEQSTIKHLSLQEAYQFAKDQYYDNTPANWRDKLENCSFFLKRNERINLFYKFGHQYQYSAYSNNIDIINALKRYIQAVYDNDTKTLKSILDKCYRVDLYDEFNKAKDKFFAERESKQVDFRLCTFSQSIDHSENDTLKLYDDLVALTQTYLKNETATNTPFKDLLSVLQPVSRRDLSTDNKIECLIRYKERLNAIDATQMDKPASWKRYFCVALSILTVLPGIILAASSYSKYHTARFWQPEGKRAYERAKELCEQRFDNRVLLI